MSRAEEEKRLAQKKKEEEERRVREVEEKKQRDIEEKRQRLEEAEKKRQAMLQAMKDASKTGPNFTIQKKSENVRTCIFFPICLIYNAFGDFTQLHLNKSRFIIYPHFI